MVRLYSYREVKCAHWLRLCIKHNFLSWFEICSQFADKKLIPGWSVRVAEDEMGKPGLAQECRRRLVILFWTQLELSLVTFLGKDILLSNNDNSDSVNLYFLTYGLHTK
jgi:hypothetical protein